jgi:glucose-1-phosphate thymidylyltransferase
MQTQKIQRKMVGLIPAAGKAERISPVPCSKEIYPVGFDRLRQNKNWRIKVVSEYLIESMYSAKVSEIYIILRKGKWDIPQYLGSGKWMNLNFAYLIMDLPFGVPFTLDQAFNFVKDAVVVFGFPDIIFKPKDAFIQLLNKASAGRADIVLGLFRAPRPYKMQHLVDFDSSGQVNGFQIRPSQTVLQYTWVIAVWNSKFTLFLHEYVSNKAKKMQKGGAARKSAMVEEVSMTHAFQIALKKGLAIDSVLFEKGSFVDIGSAENLTKACPNFTEFAEFEETK